MQDYSLGLALFDYLPVAMSAVGLGLLAQLLSRALPASLGLLFFGAGLVVAGGLCKATWKLIWVLTGQDIAWLDALLFICIAPGMLLLACHAAAASKRWRNAAGATHPGRNSLLLAMPLLVAAGLAAVFAEGRAWFFLLLTAGALANIALALVLIRLSWGWGQGFAGAFFLLSILLTLGLSALARIPEQTAALQWLEESINLLAQGCFAFGVWRLRPVAPSLDSCHSGTHPSLGPKTHD